MENNHKSMEKAATILEKYYNSDEVQEWLNTPLGAFELTEEKRGQIDCQVIKKNAGIERLKRDCLEAQKKYDECWEDQPFDENDEKFTCTRCGGMLYIE